MIGSSTDDVYEFCAVGSSCKSKKHVDFSEVHRRQDMAVGENG